MITIVQETLCTTVDHIYFKYITIIKYKLDYITISVERIIDESGAKFPLRTCCVVLEIANFI